VTTPVGTSTPPTWAPSAHRTTTSAPSTTTTPDSAETGRSARCRSSPGTRGPSRRTIAGAASPTKPTGPATVTDAADSATASSTTGRRVCLGWSPSAAAASSPKPCTSSRPASANSPTTPTSTTGVIQASPSPPYWLSEPLPQAKSPTVCSRNSSSRVTVTASNASAIAEPANTSRVGPAPTPEASTSTSPAAARPPTKASPPANGTGSATANTAATTRAT